MEISYVEEIYLSEYKQFLSFIDHLNYHPSINSAKHAVTHSQVDTKTH